MGQKEILFKLHWNSNKHHILFRLQSLGQLLIKSISKLLEKFSITYTRNGGDTQHEEVTGREGDPVSQVPSGLCGVRPWEQGHCALPKGYSTVLKGVLQNFSQGGAMLGGLGRREKQSRMDGRVPEAQGTARLHLPGHRKGAGPRGLCSAQPGPALQNLLTAPGPSLKD